MFSHEQVRQVVFGAIDEINEQLAADQRLTKSAETALIGNVDSLHLVGLLVAIERRLEQELQVAISLTAEEGFLLSENGPLRTVTTLSSCISRLLEERRGA